MVTLESTTHSFIVRIWLEETAEEAGQALWRGHITHVPTGQRRHIEKLEQIGQFIGPFLKELGVEFVW